jgi:hypothetical protein
MVATLRVREQHAQQRRDQLGKRGCRALLACNRSIPPLAKFWRMTMAQAGVAGDASGWEWVTGVLGEPYGPSARSAS